VSQLALDFLRGGVALNPGFQHVLVTHCTIAGARAQNHQRMGADGVVFGQYDLQEAGFYAVLAGHIHLHQGFGDNPRHFYNGSIAALDYGECPDKYYTVLDTATGEVVRIKLNTIHRQDINAAWTPTGIKIDESVPVELLFGARVRANLRVLGGDNVEIAKQQLAKFLELDAQALEFQINPQVVPTSKVRAVEITRAIRLSDKLKQYWEATGYPDESTQVDMIEKLAQLEDECSL
jgi:DNA repair exonuclease SbcCD nuclease subunit